MRPPEGLDATAKPALRGERRSGKLATVEATVSEVLPPALFLLSLLLLRHQVVRDVGLGVGHSLSLGLYLGWAADAALVMGAEAIAQLLWEATARVRRRWSWTVIAAA